MEYDDARQTDDYIEWEDASFNPKIIKKKFGASKLNTDGNKRREDENCDPLTNNTLHEVLVTGESKQISPHLKSGDVDPIRHNDDKDQNELNSPHIETFLKIHALNQLYGGFVGLNLNPTWKYNHATRWTQLLLIFGTVTIVYSHFIFISEPSKLIEVFCIFGIVVPAFEKFNLVVHSWKEVLSINLFVEKVFRLIPDGPKALVLKQHIDESFANIKVFLIIQTLALVIFASYPVYGYFVRNELIPLTSMQFPFLNEDTTFGYIVSNAIMLKMGLWAYFGSVGFDLFIARSIFNYTALVKLLKHDLREYADMWKNSGKYSEQHRREFLQNFLLKCHDKDRYIQYINNLFAGIIFRQFCILYVCLTFTIYAIIRNDWYSGYGFMIFCLCELYILCMLGTSIKTENDSFCCAIYDIPWYEYPVPIQRIFSMLLHSSQNSMELWIGPIAPLNVSTAMEITKSIYSTSTMIMNTA